jgi:hypothetical protein
MRTVASRIRALPEAFHKKEAYIQVPNFLSRVPGTVPVPLFLTYLLPVVLRTESISFILFVRVS